jgi:SulP family sulfate permease
VLCKKEINRQPSPAGGQLGITFHLSEVKGPIMDRLQRSHFLKELTGKVHLSQYEAVSSINPDLARRTREAQRVPSTVP